MVFLVIFLGAVFLDFIEVLIITITVYPLFSVKEKGVIKAHIFLERLKHGLETDLTEWRKCHDQSRPANILWAGRPFEIIY